MRCQLPTRTIAAAAAVFLAAACGTDGRELRQPSQPATTTTTALGTTRPSSEAGTNGAEGLQLTAPAFEAGAAIPEHHTCDGDEVSPQLKWANLPAGTTELALVVRDPDADGFVHWVVAGISPAQAELPEGSITEEAVEANNGFGNVGWAGPCPPTGTHRYEFKLYALSNPPQITHGQDAKAAAETIESAAALATASLTGTYSAG